MTRRYSAGVFILGVLLLFVFRPIASAGQVMDNRWSEPYRLSSQDASASKPYMVSDQYGLVHVFWVETGSADGRAAILYTNFNGTTWASPVDVYAAAPGLPIVHVTITVDGNGFLHLAWSEGETGPVYYTSAPAYDALTVRHWQKPVRLDIPTFLFEILVDSAGVFHVLYAQPASAGSGLYYKRSEDKGESWLNLHRLDPDAPPNLIPSVIQFVLDENDGLHATWTYIDLNIAVGAAGTWLRYSHSLDGGQNWVFPITIDEADESPEELRMAFPAMTVLDGVVNIVWAGDEGVHREHRYSTDWGESWSETKHVFGELMGQARGDGLAVDSLGRTHFIGNIRWPTGLYHAYWDGIQWSPISLAYLIRLNSSDESGERISAHDIRLAVRAGNQLVATFGDAPGEPKRGLYAMQRILTDAPELTIEPTPTVTPTPTPPPTSTPLAPLPSPTPVPFRENSQPAVANTSPGNTLLLGVAPILLLLGLIFAVRVALLRR
ncbi:MAG: hypothetical protein L0331_02255 [Chloroflexi bacterium]|nr:hypothetical protein [Chloroflexota bacterium]